MGAIVPVPQHAALSPFASVGIFSDPEKFRFAKEVASELAKSELVPSHFRGKAANCLLAYNIAERMGEDVFTTMQNLSIVNGRPAWITSYMISRANRSGVFTGPITWRAEGEGDNLSVTAHAVLAATGEPVDIPVSMQMAEKDGWTRNPKYRSMPEHMLRYRSAAMLIRLFAPQVMLGLHTREEVETIPQPPLQPEPARIVPPAEGQRRLPPRSAPAAPEPTPEPPEESALPEPEPDFEALVKAFEDTAPAAQSRQDLDDCAAELAPLMNDARFPHALRERAIDIWEESKRRIEAAAQADAGHGEDVA